MEIKWIIFMIALAIYIAIYISWEVTLRKKNKRIAELHDENLLLKGQFEWQRKEMDSLNDLYMASLEREARKDG